MDDSIKIEGYYNLLALHRTLIEAKFHENPDNYEIYDSPLVAEICNQAVEKIIELESNKNPIKGESWGKWLTIDCNHWIVERIVQNIKNNPSNDLGRWKAFNEIDKKEKIQCMLAPFKLSEEDTYKLIKNIDYELESDLNRKLVGIKTELGYIYGRDGIYIDYFNQDGNVININGEINGKLCSKLKNDSWYKYELIFNNVLIYESQHIDMCRWETETSFDEILGEDEFNNYLVNKKLYRGFVLSSYSYIYKIFATNYHMNILEKRIQQN